MIICKNVIVAIWLLWLSSVRCQRCLFIENGIYQLETSINFSNPYLERSAQTTKNAVVHIYTKLQVNFLVQEENLDFYEFRIVEASALEERRAPVPNVEEPFYASFDCITLVNYFCTIGMMRK